MPANPTSLDPKFVYLLDGGSRMYLWIGSQSRLLIQTRGRLLAEKIAQKERLTDTEILLEMEGKESNEFWAILMGLWKPALQSPLADVDSSELPKKPNSMANTATLHLKPPSIVKKPVDCPRDFIPVDWKMPQPIIYDVHLGKGYVELFQVTCIFFPASWKISYPFSLLSCV